MYGILDYFQDSITFQIIIKKRRVDKVLGRV
jgi:hypothetical protein